nr:immunoglobulin light chain junction region [Macaca mulatta]
DYYCQVFDGNTRVF